MFALFAYAGTLRNHSHLSDGTYAVVVADWSEAALLATVSGEGYAYTVTTDLASPTGFVVLDPTGKSGIPGALTPGQYVAKCAALKQRYPKLHGIFLDNTEAQATGLPNCTAAEFLAAIKHVSAGLASHGLAWMANCGGYIPRNPGSSDGTVWATWAKQIGPYFARLLLENWQDAQVQGVYRKRLRGPAWYQNWDAWQKCVGAVPGKFVGITYDPDGTFGVYGRASMLTAPGHDPRNCFFAPRGTTMRGADVYGQPWMKRNPTPHVDPVRGTASL